MSDNFLKKSRALPRRNSVLTVAIVCLGFSLGLSIVYLRTGFLDVDVEIPENSVFQVFYDRGEGFNEQDSRYYRPNRLSFERRILLPSKTKTLRIDPVNSDEPVRFRKLLFKPFGQVGKVNLLEADGVQQHTISVFNQDQQNEGLLIPEKGTTDPYLVFPMSAWGGQADSIHPGSVNWASLLTTTFLITGVLLVVFLLLRMVFVWSVLLSSKFLVTLRGCYETERFKPMRQLHLLSCITIGMMAVLISILSKCSLMHHYTICFDLTSSDSDYVGVFFDQGYGFNKNDLVYRRTKGIDQKQTHVARFKTAQELQRIRIDPGNHSGTFLLENIRVRKAFGNWHRLDFRDWSARSEVHIEKQNAEQLAISSEGGDPYVFSGPLNIDFGSSSFPLRRAFGLFAVFLSVTLLLLAYNFWRNSGHGKDVPQIVS